MPRLRLGFEFALKNQKTPIRGVAITKMSGSDSSENAQKQYLASKDG